VTGSIERLSIGAYKVNGPQCYDLTRCGPNRAIGAGLEQGLQARHWYWELGLRKEHELTMKEHYLRSEGPELIYNLARHTFRA